MLPADARLRTAEEFRSVVRGGVRVAKPTLVVHALAKPGPPSRAGFVVSKAVGNAVTRNRVKRQLRHLAAARLDAEDVRSVDLVVRALPAAASGRLGDDFAAAWGTALARLGAAA
ncbi:ribonuclease P protein component [Propioniciclava sp.]|uniref:ribonuclease P protein component n=1 Tax=Propioniciclava sp. TaxID=2038686 RepID=UPI0026294C80|nr:ribonuclease P protein component [Propioniciclava sp.]